MLTTIPFAGFYNSMHDDELDRALEQAFADDSGCHQVSDELHQHAFDAVEWGAVHTAYAVKYVKSFADKFKLKLKFDELKSPREYNFGTDRIFATITQKEVRRMRREVDQAIFKRHVEEDYTSRSGFMSYYEPDVRKWKPWKEWDHNQVGTLLRAFIETKEGAFDYDAERDLVEDWSCNGHIENMLFADNPKLNRLANIRDYLVKRKER